MLFLSMFHLQLMQGNAVLNSGMLLIAVMSLLFPTLLHYTHSEVYAASSELVLSRSTSCIMLVAYAAYLFFQLKSQPSFLTEVLCLPTVFFLQVINTFTIWLSLFPLIGLNLCCLVNFDHLTRAKKLRMMMKFLRYPSGKLSSGF